MAAQSLGYVGFYLGVLRGNVAAFIDRLNHDFLSIDIVPYEVIVPNNVMAFEVCISSGNVIWREVCLVVDRFQETGYHF